MTTITIIDYQLGNLRSIANAVNHLGCDTVVTSSPELIRGSTKLILPGVGAFPEGIASLRDIGADKAIIEAVSRGAHLLGICLGMQLLFDVSYEHTTSAGLGLISGSINNIADSPAFNETVRLPHIGWTNLNYHRSLFKNGTELTHSQYFYFVHSYMAIPLETDVIVASANYNGIDIPAIVQSGRVTGCQFHPEKSAECGLSLLKSFMLQDESCAPKHE